MIPKWALGFWYSRWYPYRDREIIDLVKRYRREGIPIDVIMIDTDWRGGWAGYDWCKKYFPRPQKTLEELHALGVKVGLNDHPGYDDYEFLPESDSHYKRLEKRLGPLPHQGGMVCDWSRPDAVAAWEEEVLGPFFDQGIDFWWIDGWTKSQFGGNDPQLWLNQRYFELREKRTGKRGLILSRWGGPGSHRYPVQFSGDTYSNWETLREEVGFTADSCGLGAVYWSHDIGGFHNREVDEELFARWSQFGAFSPIFRTHSAFGVREPWKFSKWVQDSFRHYTRMRYALLPYLYNLVWEAYKHGMPLVRPLYLEASDEEPAVYRARDQYLLGPFILVVPAVGAAAGPDGAYSARAYFPRGRWYELEGERVLDGGRYHTVVIPRDRIGLYIREGAIIPCARVGRNSQYDDSMIELDCFPGETPSQFFVYQDDGESHEYRQGIYRLTPLRMYRRGGELTLEIGPPRGRLRTATSWLLRIRLGSEENIRAAEYRYGRGHWQRVSMEVTDECLAGEVQSTARFAFGRIPAGEGKLKVRFEIE